MEKIAQYQSEIPPTVSSEALSLITNIIIGTSFDDVLAGTSLDDLVLGLAGNDRIIGSIGNDILVGGSGTDIVDYSELGRAVTLEAAGVVNKGRAGKDQILEIETIIGAKGQANAIDGSTGISTTTSLNVNLLANSLIVNGIPGLGSLNFQVQNFVNVTGTSQADTIIGDSANNLLEGGKGNDEILGGNGNDTVRGGDDNDVIGGGSKGTIFASRLGDGNDTVEGGSGDDILIGGTGNDLLDGGTGIDTADYSGLGNSISLEAVGIVNKGISGKDQILNIETIIGAKGQANAIDGSTGTSTTTSFNVNLSANSLIVNGIPGLGSLNFQVQNFVNVTGTSQADTIIGNSANNLLKGGKGNDQLSGLDGKDILVGVDTASVQPGIKEIDILTGGADADTFVIGDQKNPYYVGGGGFFGLNDFAFIGDFQTGQDQIQLKKLENYIFGRNYIAVRSPFESTMSDTLSDSQLESTVNEIINNSGAIDSLSLGVSLNTTENSTDSSFILPRFDVITILANNYSLSDIQFV
jgi:Ca2+-binding RTX toxin-like protein